MTWPITACLIHDSRCARAVWLRKGRCLAIVNLGADDELPPVDWAGLPSPEKLDAGSVPVPVAPNARTTWLATVNEDGGPHVTAVGAL